MFVTRSVHAHKYKNTQMRVFIFAPEKTPHTYHCEGRHSIVITALNQKTYTA
jgi:hypothetical protein